MSCRSERRQTMITPIPMATAYQLVAARRTATDAVAADGEIPPSCRRMIMALPAMPAPPGMPEIPPRRVPSTNAEQVS